MVEAGGIEPVFAQHFQERKTRESAISNGLCISDT